MIDVLILHNAMSSTIRYSRPAVLTGVPSSEYPPRPNLHWALFRFHEQGASRVRKVTVARPSSCVSVADFARLCRILPRTGLDFLCFQSPGTLDQHIGVRIPGGQPNISSSFRSQPASDFRLVAPRLRFVRRLFSNRAIHPRNVSSGNQVAVGVYRTTVGSNRIETFGISPKLDECSLGTTRRTDVKSYLESRHRGL